MQTMDSADTAKAFNDLFMKAYQRFYRRVRPTAYRPRPEALAVLRHLNQTGPLTVTEAARHFSRSQASMSEIVTRLESRDLVQRVPDRRDRRRQLVWLTTAGLKAHDDSIRVLSLGKLEQAFEQLDQGARREAVTALQKLLATEPTTEGWDDE